MIVVMAVGWRSGTVMISTATDLPKAVFGAEKRSVQKVNQLSSG